MSNYLHNFSTHSNYNNNFYLYFILDKYKDTLKRFFVLKWTSRNVSHDWLVA